MLKTILLIGSGGFLGSVLRYFSQIAVQRYVPSFFPVGTMFVNIVGSLIIGLVYGYVDRGQYFTPEIRMFMAVGFCGGFTTFSSYTWDIINISSSYGFLYNLLYVAGSIVLGVLFAWLGMVLIKGL